MISEGCHLPPPACSGFDSCIRGNFQTCQCRPNALQALRVAPLLYARKADPALTATQIFVFDQTPDGTCEAVNSTARRRVAVIPVIRQVRDASRLAGDNNRKAGAHGFVHGKPPVLLYGWKHEYVRRGIKTWQLRLVDEACKHDVIECI